MGLTQHVIILVGLVLLTVASYLPILDGAKEFTNLDDGVYVVDQPLVRAFDASTIATLFDPSTEVSSNYHPLTMVSLGIDHALFGMDASAFARTNLLFHVLNTILVFFVVFHLLDRNVVAAGIAACLWGIHPMHVESVAWISERKDVLYTFFLLLSLLSYQRYLRDNNLFYFVLTSLAFVASCLSKAMAVPLPIALFVLDYYYKRGLSIRSVIEKIPLLAVSVWVGITAISIQSKAAIAEFDVITPMQRIAFAGYGFVMYWVKMLAPFELSAFYPYPTTGAGGEVHPLYFLMPFLAAAIVAVPVLLSRGNKPLQRLVVVGMALFALFVALVLQLISVGQVIMAERYTYVPYLGSLLLLAYVLWRAIERWKLIGWGITLGFIAMCSALTYTQAGVWKTSETLWTQVIERYPYEWTQTGDQVNVTRVGVAAAYGSRASYYMTKGLDDKAYQDLQVFEVAKAPDVKGMQMLGVVYGRRKEYAKSIAMLDNVVAQKPNWDEPYFNRAISYAMVQRHAEAAADFERALALGVKAADQRMAAVGAAREHLNAKQYQACIVAAERVMALFPDEADGPFLKGTAMVNLKRYDEALQLLNASLTLAPNNAAAWFNIAVAHKGRGAASEARTAAARAAALGFNVPQGAF